MRGIVPSGGKSSAKDKRGSKRGKAGRKPLGVALVAGAAGLAFSQRDKLMSKLGGGHEQRRGDGVTPATGPDVAAPPVAPPPPAA